MPQPDIYELLKADHRRVERLFTQITENHQIGAQTSLPGQNPFTQLYQTLMAHMKAEEETAHAVLKDKPETRSRVLDGMKEHDRIRDLLNQTRNMPRGSPDWMTKLRDAQELVERHVRDEEGEMFKGAQKVLNDAQALELGEQRFLGGLVIKDHGGRLYIRGLCRTRFILEIRHGREQNCGDGGNVD